MGGRSEQTVGFKYYMDMHLISCLGPVDSLKEIMFDERSVWKGEETVGLYVNEPTVFGGDDSEGGVAGLVDVMLGHNNQQVSEGLVRLHGSGPIPAYRMRSGVFLNDFYFGNNPYIKRIALKWKRTLTDWEGGAIWNAIKADINGSMNVAHIVRELLTSRIFGKGYPATSLDDNSFTQSANKLYSEGFGLSFKRVEEEPISNVLDRIMAIVDGKIYEDENTGKIRFELLRKDYSVENIRIIDDTNSKLIDMQKNSENGNVNQVIVEYKDQETGEDRSVSVQNIANIVSSGRIISQTKRYTEVPFDYLARNLAVRELSRLSSELQTFNLTLDRSFWNLRKGDPVRYRSTRYGVDVICRLSDITFDNENDKIEATIIEDFFDMPEEAWISKDNTESNPPNVRPSIDPQVEEAKIIEMPYYEMHQKNIDKFSIMVAAKQVGNSYGYRLYADTDQNNLENMGPTFPYVGVAELGADITEELSSQISAINIIGVKGTWQDLGDGTNQSSSRINSNSWFLIGDEIVQLVSSNQNWSSNETLQVNRGCLDTIPVEHFAGEKIWFIQEWSAVPRKLDFLYGETVYAKLQPTASYGVSDFSNSFSASIQSVGRSLLPYTPGNVKINGVSFPSSASGDLLISWKHRNRLVQVSSIPSQFDGNVGQFGETGYVVQLINGNSVVKEWEIGSNINTKLVSQSDINTYIGSQRPINISISVFSRGGNGESFNKWKFNLMVSA